MPSVHRLAALTASVMLLAGAAAPAAHSQHSHRGSASSPAAPREPVRIGMEALHAAGGVPPGWRFSLPLGNPTAGRQVFIQFKCYTCHAVKGEQFPLQPGETVSAGPDLTGMGSHHPTGYFVESIVNPSAVVVDGPGYVGGDGRSVMPPTPDMTVGQLIDLVAYLESLTGQEHGHDHDIVQERPAGAYLVRLMYRPAPAGAHEHGHHAHAGGTAGHLMVFVSDKATGQAVPYLPVTVRVEASRVRTARLQPMMGPAGFHYGTDIALPAGTRRVTVMIGLPAMRLMKGLSSGFGSAQSVTFEWADG
jgi:hypothetical protein